MLPYLSHKEAMKQRYGEALFRIPVDVDFGCPNRHSDGSGGCSFCPEHGARAAQIGGAANVEEQIQKALSFAKRRYNAKRFALYVQAYTGTFASIIRQKEIYEHLLNLYAFDAIYIGTRPDCLSEATLDYLQTLNQTIDVVVELGVQSLHDASLVHINRGHDAACSLHAIARLKERGIGVYAHLIIGLPGEDKTSWLQTLQGVVDAGIEGIKFHNLHIIRNTALAREFEENPFVLLSEYEYAEALIDLLRHVPSHMPILRLATDTPHQELIAPKWHMAKGQFGEYVVQTMRYRGIKQGDLAEEQSKKKDAIPSKIDLKDGSTTFWNETYRDYYHPKAGAYAQAQTLFLKGSQLQERLAKGYVKLLEVGFGMGYNVFESLRLAQTLSTNRLQISAIDQDKILLQKACEVVPESLHVRMLQELFEQGKFEETYASVALINQEARFAINHIRETFDVIFLDPFVENRNASLVTFEFLQMLRRCLKQDGVLVASTSLKAVSSALRACGFDVRVMNDETNDIQGIVANISSSYSLSSKGYYCDPYGVWSDKYIEMFHQKSSK